MKKIMLVFGTRPEAIKMAPLVKAFQQKKNKFKTIVCVTGQHRKMLDQVLKLFNIRPDYDLNIMRQGQDLYDITARVLTGMRGVLQEAKPDIVLVHGDTTTSTASALAAFYQQIPVGHVEAGLRTYNIYSPWPEEMNRQITGRIATWHFSPTPLSRNNLIHEGIDKDKILITGNTVIDALYYVVATIRKDSTLLKQLDTELMSVGYETTPLAEQNTQPQTGFNNRSSPGKLRRWIYPDMPGNKDSGRAVCGGRLCLPYALEPKCKEAHSRNIRKCLSP